jgi:thiamine-phosphate pyrophosphorylase
MPFPDRKLYLLFTPALAGPKPWRTLQSALQGGVDLVQWRCKERDEEGYQRCRELCGAHGVPLIVNDDVMLAVRSHAHGAHVGQDDVPAEVARRLLGEAWLGVSTHDLAQIAAAAHAGADYLGFGPCFPSATRGNEVGLPPAQIEAAASGCRLPLFAIGGIDAGNAGMLYGLGVRRIAVSRSILQADDPEAAAAALRRFL